MHSEIRRWESLGKQWRNPEVSFWEVGYKHMNLRVLCIIRDFLMIMQIRTSQITMRKFYGCRCYNSLTRVSDHRGVKASIYTKIHTHIPWGETEFVWMRISYLTQHVICRWHVFRNMATYTEKTHTIHKTSQNPQLQLLLKIVLVYIRLLDVWGRRLPTYKVLPVLNWN